MNRDAVMNAAFFAMLGSVYYVETLIKLITEEEFNKMQMHYNHDLKTSCSCFVQHVFMQE